MRTAAIGTSLMFAVIGAAPLYGVGAAHATTIVQNFSWANATLVFSSVTQTSSAAYTTTSLLDVHSTLNEFNPALGTLQSAELSVAVPYQLISITFASLQPSVVFTSANFGQFTSPNQAYYVSAAAGVMFFDFLITSPADLANLTLNAPFYDVALEINAQSSNPLGSLNLNQGAMNLQFASPTLTYSYTPAAVPEPATWAMILAGLCGVGAFHRRQTGRQNPPEDSRPGT